MQLSNSLTNRKKTYSLHQLIILLIGLIPLVDTLNGYLIKGYSISGIGTVFRLFFLGIILLYIYSREVNKFEVVIAISFIAFLLAQFIVSENYATDSIEMTVKLFTPIFMLEAFRKMWRWKQIEETIVQRLFDQLSILFSITIIVPFVLGLGYSTYRGHIGYKAFYYATNEISYAICTLLFYNLIRLLSVPDIKHYVFFFLNAICCFLIGSKVALFILFIMIALLLWNNFIYSHKSFSRKRLVLVSLFIISIIAAYNYLGDNIQKIFNRMMKNFDNADSSLVFLTSNRIVFLSEGFDMFRSRGFLCYLFGWGLGGANNEMINVEMDFFDILFSCGVIGLLTIVFLYIALYKKGIQKTPVARWLIIISLGVSFLGGHILFTGLGGMMFATLNLYADTVSLERKGK